MTTAPPLAPYPIHEQRLANGLRVIVSPDEVAPGVAVNLWYQVGSRDETPSRTGFAHLFEHLMFQGTWTGVGAGEHLAAMQAAGGEANATTSFDRTNYHETIHRGALDLALWLEAQRMEHLRVDLANFETQRDVVKEEKRQRYDNVPYGDTFELLVEQHFAGHPYDHTPIGHLADLEAAELDDVQAFFDTWYRPANASLVICGAVEVEQAFALAERHFEAIPAGSPGQRTVPPELPPHPAPTIVGVHRDVPRDAIHLGWRVPVFHHPDTMALDLGLSVLSGTQSSRLHQRLVIAEELAEGISANSLGMDGSTNLALVSARAREGVAIQAVGDRLHQELALFANDGPTTAELDRAKAQLERQWLSDLSTVDSRADALNHYACSLGDPGRLNSQLEEFLAIDAERIAIAFATWLTAEQCATLHYQSEESR